MRDARSKQPARQWRVRRGMTLTYACVLMVLLIAFVSFGVDYGRVQLTKTELQRAADAAARYGASGIVDSTYSSKAIAAAGENAVDGTPLVLSNSFTDKDVEVGNWDGTQSPKFSTSRAPTNAIRITARRVASRGTAVPLLFAKLLGMNSCDLTCTAIATQNIGDPNFIGLKAIDAKNNIGVAYDPRMGLPSAGNMASGASIASNGKIKFNNNPSIQGSVIIGPAGQYTGTTPTPIQLTDAMSFPSTESPPWAATGSLNINGTVHITGGGTVVYSSITLSNNGLLIFDNPTTVYVTGNVTFAQSGEIKPSSGLPVDLKIRMTGGATSYFGGSNSNNVTVTGQIYAPDVDFIAKNTGTVFGTALFRTMSATNNLNLYYDYSQQSVVHGLSNIYRGVLLVK
jgi:Flp pilus assembly protein TadG